MCVCLYLAANSNASTVECVGSKDEMPKTVSMVTPQVMQNSATEISQGFGIGKSVEIRPSSEISQSSAFPQSVQRISGWLPVIIYQFNTLVVQGNVM